MSRTIISLKKHVPQLQAILLSSHIFLRYLLLIIFKLCDFLHFFFNFRDHKVLKICNYTKLQKSFLNVLTILKLKVLDKPDYFSMAVL